MLRHAFRRLLWVFPSVLGVTLLSFFVLARVPDPSLRASGSIVEVPHKVRGSYWTVGSPIISRGEWKGHSYVDKGTVLAFEPERLLTTTHWSPMGGTEDRPENYHTVTYELAEESGTTTLTLTQDNNATQAEADTMAENNWGRCWRA